MSQMGVAVNAQGMIGTLTGNTGGAVGPTGGNINIVGAGGVTTTGSPGTSTITITAGASIATTYTADAGAATPVANNLNVLGGDNFNTAGAGQTLTLNLNTSIDQPVTNASGTEGMYSLGGLKFMHNFSSDGSNTFLGTNAGNLTLTGASVANVGIGDQSLEDLTSGVGNAVLGSGSGIRIDSGVGNTIAGGESGFRITSGQSNTIAGSGSGVNFTTHNNNTILGSGTAVSMIGASNIVIGQNAGSAYTTAGNCNNNIIIANPGIDGDIGLIRIGTTGTQTETHIAGISGGTSTGSSVVFVGSNGSLGTLPTGAGAAGTVLTSTGTSTAPTWQSPAGITSWTEITGTTVALAVNNGYIMNNAAGVAGTLPATAVLGSIIALVGKGVGGWLIAQNAGQTIHFGNMNTTTGAGGSLGSMLQYDCVEIICITANTDFVVKGSIGNLVVT